jgi:hypothetical protein
MDKVTFGSYHECGGGGSLNDSQTAEMNENDIQRR